ncbi:MFS general substrate transporter [Mollisia scopiformis]|uniref:MFS general substrate transporter n=1 Tax=Mollisia scopiformis TaxID=149040 RepID=A0A132B7P7_MOLSC|nr:MFS general substrate transporter [Mollisia scopiformis]KUJ08009.1 MFS general substrate transporter [Mollisia scopiformis]
MATTATGDATMPIAIKEKETKIIASESTSDVESDSSSTRRPGSIWTIIGCALANFSDGYQQSLASSTNVVFNHILGTKVYTSAIQTRISNALLVGSVIGIVVLGYTSDKFSRKGGMLFTSALVIIGSLLATLAFQVHPSHNMLWFLTIARGIAGVGVGGEYPTSAAAALEGSNEHFDNQRGPIQVLISTLMATSRSPVCTFVYLASLLASNNNLKTAYHAIYAISIFLPLLVVLFRLKMQDGLLFRKSNSKKRHVPWKLVLRKFWLRLLGTSAASYHQLSLVPGKNVRTVAVWQLILALFPVPGVLIGAWLVNRIGRTWTGILGFGGYVVLGFIIGGCYELLTTKSIPAFVVLYGLFQCMGHMGPGATIGLISVESYPTAVRGMGYGVSAGFGKAGAAIGTQVFTPIEEVAGKAATFYVAGAVAVVGMGVYWFLPEGRSVDLRVMDEEFEGFMREEGYGEKVEERS